jgi:nitrate reductase (cytochrome), electron transfer subunit
MNRILVAMLLCSCASAPRPQSAAPQPPAAAQVPAPQQPRGTPDSALGLTKGSVADVPEPLHWAYTKDGPGGNDVLPRGYPQAPPRVPHDVNDYLPITLARNRCLQCHQIAQKKTPEDPTPIPQSHYVDLRNAPGTVRKELAGARFVCSSCHVPQAPAPPPIGNGF